MLHTQVVVETPPNLVAIKQVLHPVEQNLEQLRQPGPAIQHSLRVARRLGMAGSCILSDTRTTSEARLHRIHGRPPLLSGSEGKQDVWQTVFRIRPDKLALAEGDPDRVVVEQCPVEEALVCRPLDEWLEIPGSSGRCTRT